MNSHASAPSRSRLRHGIAALLLLPLLLVLAGCFRLDMGLTINADDTLDVTMEVGDVTGMATRADMDCSELESEMVGDADGVEFTATDIEDDDGNVGCRITASGAPLDSLADDGGMSVQKVDDTYVFTFEGDGAGMQDFSDFEDMPAGMQPQVSISVTFPGSVIEADGDIDGNTVTWTGMEAFATGGTATGEASGGVLGGGGSNTVIWIILGIVILLAIVALIVLLMKKKQSASSEPVAPYGAPGAPGAPGAGYADQQPPAAPAPYTTAATDAPVHRSEGGAFAPQEPAAPQYGAPSPEAPPTQSGPEAPGEPGQSGQPGQPWQPGEPGQPR